MSLKNLSKVVREAKGTDTLTKDSTGRFADMLARVFVGDSKSALRGLDVVSPSFNPTVLYPIGRAYNVMFDKLTQEFKGILDKLVSGKL